MYKPFGLSFIRFYKDILRNSKKVQQYRTSIRIYSTISLLEFHHWKNRKELCKR